MEAKIVHALDKMETLIQHNEADIATWLPLEYDLQMTYGEKECMADPYLTKLREVIRQISEDKITAEGEDREIVLRYQKRYREYASVGSDRSLTEYRMGRRQNGRDDPEKYGEFLSIWSVSESRHR